MKTRQNRSHDAAQSRAALEALFSNSSSANPSPSSPASLEGEVLVAKKAADAHAVSSRIDLLRRKREAMQAIQEAASHTGFSLEELREVADQADRQH
ncbi:hypothetical protein [Chitinimonas taiwanensis]|jgi:hypothetical protein|uniref:Uncharacterized protein n=1 Tax=Chitinimonas taiwanensis DSM 18899 TaxID=1121279 RepID=A0A1K2HKB2_9NEIS|nr:hypothetical protein [Chitinimonas taiwanensis]SFZ77206.1 hypothetical protein SAMN02745887_02277 [Chitinimonas taiwanensis DSM 18899]